MEIAEAMEIVAKGLLGTVYLPDWEDYPEIGEMDWQAVSTKMQELLPIVKDEDFQQAYKMLEDRANADKSD